MTCEHWQYVMDYHVRHDGELGGIAWTTCRNCGAIVRTVTVGVVL